MVTTSPNPYSFLNQKSLKGEPMKPVLKPFITHNFTTAEVKNPITSFDGDIICLKSFKWAKVTNWNKKQNQEYILPMQFIVTV